MQRAFGFAQLAPDPFKKSKKSACPWAMYCVIIGKENIYILGRYVYEESCAFRRFYPTDRLR